MINFASVSIRGAFNFARARVIWHDGLLRVFGKTGPMLDIIADEPRKKPGHVWTWDVHTAKGDIVLRNKCITCGGREWWRVVLAPTDELWSSEW